MWSDEEVKGKILHKLTRLGKFKHSHTSIDNLPKGFPKDLRGRIKERIEELTKEGILFVKPTSYGGKYLLTQKRKKKLCIISKNSWKKSKVPTFPIPSFSIPPVAENNNA